MSSFPKDLSLVRFSSKSTFSVMSDKTNECPFGLVLFTNKSTAFVSQYSFDITTGLRLIIGNCLMQVCYEMARSLSNFELYFLWINPSNGQIKQKNIRNKLETNFSLYLVWVLQSIRLLLVSILELILARV